MFWTALIRPDNPDISKAGIEKRETADLADGNIRRHPYYLALMPGHRVRGTGRGAAVTGRMAGCSFSSREYESQAIVMYFAHLSQRLGKDVDNDGQLPLRSAGGSHRLRGRFLTCPQLI